MCIRFLVYLYVCVPRALPGTHRGQKRMSDLPGLELELIVSHTT